jgi:peptidyl-prolyl cis-trans isomerase D
MITLFRSYVDSWLVRGFFIIMAVSFVGWGISGDIMRLAGPPSWVAKVGGETIQIPAFQAEYQRAIAQQTRDLPSGQEASAELRRQVGQQTLEQLIAQAALSVELKKLGIVTPDEAIAEATRSIPAFQGSDGKFSKAVFDSVLRNKGFTEARFLEQVRAEMAQRQLLSAVSGSGAASEAGTKPLYAAEFEKRAADMAAFPFSAAPEPSVPDEAVLQRWYDNHPDSYATPEFRRIKAVELSPQSLAAEISITDDDLRAAYQEHKAEYFTQAKRSAEVLSTPDEGKAQALAARWRDTPDWAAMQAAAQSDGASAINQDDATEVQFPDPDLAKAVFAGTLDTVGDPVKGALGWFVVKVTKIVPGGETSFEHAKEGLRARLLAGKAADLIYDRANKVDQLLGNGTSLDDLPGDLGLAGVAGTLDAKGNTADGTPAPIPGPKELKDAIIAAAFQAHQGDPPRLTEVQTPSAGGSAYYALNLEAIIPPGKKPFDGVKEAVADDWKQDQRRRAQEQAATAMMIAVKDGKSFSDAATVAGVIPRLSALITRNQENTDVPAALQRIMFGLKKGEVTMVETPDGFVVAQVAEVVAPDAAADKTGYDQVRTAIARSVQGDLTTVFVNALRQRAEPKVNQRAFDSVVQP